MKEMNQVFCKDRNTWRSWLKENFLSVKYVWLVYFKKHTGKPSVPYNDAVEEAICFGWIDGQIKRINDEKYMQRFSPRNPKSAYSQANKERVKWLLSQKMIHPSMLEKAKEIASEKFIFPGDIMEFVKKDKVVWKNYNQFSDSYKRIRIAYIEAARKRPEEFQKRLSNFIHKTQKGGIIKGHGGIEKYY